MKLRKTLILVLAIIMAVGILGMNLNVKADSEETLVISQNGTVKLDKDITGGIHILSGVTATLDLNGHKVTGTTSTSESSTSNQATIVNEGTLEINGEGTVEGHDSYTVLNRNGKLIINGGTYTTTAEVTSTSGPGLIVTGWYDGSQNSTGKLSELTINGGTYIGGLNNVKSDEYGVLTINGGAFSEAGNLSILASGKAFTMTGGSIDKNIQIWNMGADQERTVSITGGTFANTSSISFQNNDKTKTNVFSEVTISNVTLKSIGCSSETKMENVTISNVNTVATSNDLIFKTTGNITLNNVTSNKYTSISAPVINVNGGNFAKMQLVNCPEATLKETKVTGQLSASQKKTIITIEGGEYGSIACYLSDRTAVGGTIIVNDGNIGNVDANSKGHIVINKGTISGDINAQYSAIVEITGGIIEGNVIAKEETNETLKPTITITGGTFKNAVSEAENGFVADGYGKYKVDEENYIVKEKVALPEGSEQLLKVGETYENKNLVPNDYYEVSADGETISIENGVVTAKNAGVANVVLASKELGSEENTKVTITVYDVKASNSDSENANKVTESIVEQLLEDPTKKVTGIDETTANAVIEAVKSGNTITTEVVTEELAEPTKEDKALIEEKLEDAKIVGFYDVSVVLKVNDEEIGKITELSKTVVVELTVPKDLKAVEEGYTRTYSVIRIHDGKAEVIAEGLTEKEGKILAETDKFSTYGLAYTDTKTQTIQEDTTGDKELGEGTETKQEEVKKDETKTEETKNEEKTNSNPTTGDTIFAVVAVLMLSAVGIEVTNKMRKMK